MNYDDLADLYDHQYDTYRDDLHHYARLAENTGGRVLELGAGTGRVTVHLARRGARITGLEPSARMLERAEERAREADARVTLVQGDMRDFTLHERFDLIIAPFNALMHLYTPQDQLSALRRVHAHLHEGGTFAFDVYVPNFGPEGVLRHEGETFRHPDGSRTDVFVLQRVERARQVVTTDYLVDTTAPDGTLKRAHRTLTQRYYTRFELEWMLRHAGFTARFHGSFEGGPYGDDSHVMVVTARPETNP